MANFDLNKFYKKSSDIKSPVDSRIQMNKADTDGELWGDIKLDLDINEIKSRSFNAKESNKDLQRIVNRDSVIASLKNIFNTGRCSRLLNPEIDFEMKKYLFEPITKYKAWFIGYDIHTVLPTYEPRVVVNNVNVIGDIENDCYYIQLSITIPQLGEDVNLTSVLSPNGYSIL